MGAKRRQKWNMAQKVSKRQNAEKLHVENLFERLVRGASLAELTGLAHPGVVMDSVEIFDLNTRSVCSAKLSGVPWTVLWLVATFSKKHVHCSRKPLIWDMVSSDLEQFHRKLSWRWCLQSSAEPPCVLRLRGIPTPAWPVTVDAGLKAWLLKLRSTVASEFTKSRRHFLSAGKSN